MALVVAIAGTGVVVSEAQVAAAASARDAVIARHGDCLGAQALADPGACRGTIPASVLVPDPVSAGADDLNLPACWAQVNVAELHVCSFGPDDAPVRVIAIGDSHSNALLAAYRGIADRKGWRIDVAGHNGCYWTTAVQEKPTQALVDACEAWKQALDQFLDANPPYQAILVTHARFGAPVIASAGEDLKTTTVRGLLDAWATQTRRGSRILVIRDNPRLAEDVVSCVVRYGVAANAHCARAQARAIGVSDPLVEAAALSKNARLIDLTDIYCPNKVCVPIIGNVVVYANRDHITGTFATTLVSVLAEMLATALAAA